MTNLRAAFLLGSHTGREPPMLLFLVWMTEPFSSVNTRALKTKGSIMLRERILILGESSYFSKICNIKVKQNSPTFIFCKSAFECSYFWENKREQSPATNSKNMHIIDEWCHKMVAKNYFHVEQCYGLVKWSRFSRFTIAPWNHSGAIENFGTRLRSECR